MPDEKQLGLLRDILDSAKTIREYLRGVTGLGVRFIARRSSSPEPQVKQRTVNED